MSSETTVLITGSSGFVGTYAVGKLAEKYQLKCVSLRRMTAEEVDFDGVEVILHLAGKAHQMQKIDPQEYFEVNCRKTLDLARVAKEKGVRHFIFMSTVKVYGDVNDRILDERSECHPTDPYGESKLQAENGLLKMADDHFVVSIIRPPLVYGPGVKGNLERLTGLIRKLPFLPFGGIDNERSMVFVGNLTALTIAIIESAKGGIFIAGDQSRESTSTLVQTMIRHMNLNKQNIRIPAIVRRLIARLKPELYSRLFESYIIENAHTNKRLSFTPPFSFDEGVKAMVVSENPK